MLNQLRGMWDELFTGTCDNCRGAGTVICTRCHGTKSLRRRPAQLRIKDLDLLDAPGDLCAPHPPSKLVSQMMMLEDPFQSLT